MKVLVIGSTGTIGREVVKALAAKGHEVIGVSRHSAPGVDIQDPQSIAALFANVRGVNAIVSCAGGGAWKPLAELTDEDFAQSLGYKLMGQVNVIRQGLRAVANGGSITVTSGVLAQNPIPNAAAVAMLNAGLEGFVRAAAIEAPRGIRVNVVSPPWATETLKAWGMDPTHGTPAAQMAQAYVQAVEGTQTGATIAIAP